MESSGYHLLRKSYFFPFSFGVCEYCSNSAYVWQGKNVLKCKLHSTDCQSVTECFSFLAVKIQE